MKKLTSLLISSILILFLIYIFTYSKDVMESVTFSISIWKDNLFPSLFPFLIISYFFVNYGISNLFSEILKPLVVNILHLPSNCGYTIILSLFSGFPSSAKFIKDELEKDEINLDTANYLLKFCHFSNPLFVIGTIGTLMLGNNKLGFLILISHYIGSFVVALIFRDKKKKYEDNKIDFKDAFRKINKSISNSSSFATVLKNAIKSAIDTLFLLLGIICVFLIITTIITKVIPLSDTTKSTLSGILEMTQGIKYASTLNIPIISRMLLMTSFISFGGLSIHTQVLSILSNYKISYLSYFSSRIIHAIISCITLILIYTII